MNLSDQAASLEAQVESLTTENRVLRRARSLNEVEITRLGTQNAKLESKCDDLLQQNAKLKGILEYISSAIVRGVRDYQTPFQEAAE